MNAEFELFRIWIEHMKFKTLIFVQFDTKKLIIDTKMNKIYLFFKPKAMYLLQYQKIEYIL